MASPASSQRNSATLMPRGWLVCGVLAGLLLAMSHVSAFAGSQQATDSAPPPLSSLFGGPFSLIDHTGTRRSDGDFRGKFMLIYFGYTFCPTICPANLQHMADAQDRLGGEADNIVPIFVSIDPKRDTPEVLRDYVANFGDGFVGLTGSEAQIRAVAKSYRVHRRKVVEAGAAAEDYLVDHASITYLMGPDGKFRTLFPHDTPGKAIAERISKYLSKERTGESN